MRSRPAGRIAVALAAACVVVTAACSSGGASGTGSDRGTYLALGDSVPFGFRSAAVAEFPHAENFVGYPELVGEDLHLHVINASCPGETTASFLDVTAQSNGCENGSTPPGGYRTTFPLHVDYASLQQSQLDYAVQALKARDDVKLVTLQIGANDAGLCRATTPDKCTSEIRGVVDRVGKNVARVLDALRNDAGYDGTIVVVTYYSPDYANLRTTIGTQLVNTALTDAATAAGAEVADAFDAFEPEAEAAGGSSIAAGLVLPGDVHPSEEGQQLLADTVMSAVNG